MIGVCEGVFANLAMICDLYGEHLGGSKVEGVEVKRLGARSRNDSGLLSTAVVTPSH
jgi:hypothetical protein